MLALLTDKLILKPTRHAIAAEGKSCRTITYGGGRVEVWTQTTAAESANGDDGPPELFILKFPGTGGRAERASAHPAEFWQGKRVQTWAMNPPGYGGSSGRASLSVLAKAARAVFEEFRRAADGRAMIVTGNSLGTATALHIAANYPVDGLLLRNPPPLRQVIKGRFGWWNLGIAAGLVAKQVPDELCSITNAGRTAAPTLFVMSGRDRVVPPAYQHQIIEAHAGQKRIMLLPDADHACPIDEEQFPEYAEHLTWLRDRIGEHHQSRRALKG